jgi:hypothetical protein
MSTVTVSRAQLHGGALPPICIVSGRAADGTVTATFSRLPTWTYLLLLAGIVPFVIAALFAPERLRAEVPVHAATLEGYHRLSRRILLSWVFVLAFGAAAIFTTTGWLWFGAAVGIVVLAVSLAQRTHGWVEARPVSGTPLVELRRVSPEFAAAVAQAPTLS